MANLADGLDNEGASDKPFTESSSRVAPSHERSLTTRRIFVVDDEPSMIQLCTIILERDGLTVVGSALDGVEAILGFKALKVPPDMVLMDHRMPRKNGLETMKELLAIEPNLKILFISADTSITALALEAGAAGFLPKPFGVSQLTTTVRRILQQTDDDPHIAPGDWSGKGQIIAP